MLALDLGVFNRKSHTISVKQALGWTAVWVSLSLAFAGGIWRFMGAHSAIEFITGYVVEYAGDLGEFVPWLKAAEIAGVGRQAAWGKGEIRISVTG